MSIQRFGCLFVLLLAVYFPPQLTGATQQTPTLRFGIVPQQSATRLASLWVPILEYLGKPAGVRLVFETAPNIPEFERRLFSGQYDLAYMNPYHYTVAHRRPGYQAFAKQQNKRIQGILVVRKDSGITGLAQLSDQPLAFPSPAAFAASILTRANLRQEGIPFHANYVSSHDSVYRSVALGLYPAGGGIYRTFENTAPAIRQQLRVLWESRSYTPHAFAAHPDLAPELVARIKQAMLQMRQDERGAQLLKAINFEGIVTASDREWDDIRALDIRLLRKEK